MIAFFPVPYYSGTITVRTSEFCERFHFFIIALFVLPVFILSYILDHLPEINFRKHKVRFSVAERIFDDLKRIERIDEDENDLEERWQTIRVTAFTF
jgi:hypothetical protein